MSIIPSHGAGRRCVVFGYPVFGHTNPLLLLCEALIQSGYAVSFYNAVMHKAKIEELGAEFIDYNSPSVVEAFRPMECNSVDLDFLYAEAIGIYLEVWPALSCIAGNEDLVIYDQFAIWGKRFAEKNHIISLCSNTFLLTTTQYWENNFSPSKLINDRQAWEEYTNCLSGTSADGIIVYTPRELQLTPSADDKRKIFYLANRFAGQHPASMADFNEEALIYICLGTIFNCNEILLRLLIEYFIDNKYRIVISAGNNYKVYATLSRMDLPRNIEVHNFVDQLAILQKASLFITHGGINSLYEGIYFGVPMIMFPQMEEQHINAKKAEDLNIAYHCRSREASKQTIDEAMITIKQNWTSYKENLLFLREAIIRSSDAKEVAKQISTFLDEFPR